MRLRITRDELLYCMKNILLIPLWLFTATSLLQAQSGLVDEGKYVQIGGIEQWVTITGDDRRTPVILFLHGGPGSTMSQYQDTMFDQLKKEFILVNWDQRGAGRTYGRNLPEGVTEDYWLENPLTVEQMASDGVELVEYLLEYLNKDQVFLFGSSWGSILGMEMVLNKPDLFKAYVGHAQFVNLSNNIGFAYEKVWQLAKDENNQERIDILESLGKPPYQSAKSYGQLLRVVKSYEREQSTPAPESWFQLKKDYDNPEDSRYRYEGDDYSFIYFVGHGQLGIPSMVSEIDFHKSAVVLEVPVFLIQGAHDILTASDINKPYFERLQAPEKEYFLIQDAAHGFNQSIVDQIDKVVKRYTK